MDLIKLKHFSYPRVTPSSNKSEKRALFLSILTGRNKWPQTEASGRNSKPVGKISHRRQERNEPLPETASRAYHQRATGERVGAGAQIQSGCG